MSTRDPAQRDALVRLGASSAEAIAQVLEMFAPGQIERGDVSVLPEGSNPFSSLTRGAVAASVSYVEGVTGANVFALTPAGARNLASAMGVPAPEPEDVAAAGADETSDGDSDAEAETETAASEAAGDDAAKTDGEDAPAPAGAGDEFLPLSELEMSAIAEAANQTMAAAASAIGVVLGQEVDISPPEMRVIDDPADAAEHYGSSPHATSTTFLIGGESCRLIQLVPAAFLVRMERALDEIGPETDDDAAPMIADGDDGGSSMGLVDALGEIKLRVWAELGRTHLPIGRALGLPLGSVVELDRTSEAPIDLYVNGLRFAQGRLIVTDDGEWAFACDEVGGRRPEPVPSPESIPEPEHEGALT
jgi:flagellar motor switch protein FliN